MALRRIEFYIVTPSQKTNLITNPSFEVGTTGYTRFNAGTIARSTTYQRRGAACCLINPPSNAAGGVYYPIALTSGQTYTFSADVLDVAGQTFELWFATTGAALKGTKTTWTGTGHWRRRSVTWTADASATFWLVLSRPATASILQIFTDGWQLETGTETTYFDGDTIGYNRARRDYLWNGTRHASTSTRRYWTRSGGAKVRLKDFCDVAGFVGLGMLTLTNTALPLNSGGSFYQDTVANERNFSIAVEFTGSNYGDIMADRSAITDAINPDNVPVTEPLTILAVTTDANGVEQSDPVRIAAVYGGGLEGDTTGDFAQTMDKAVINFTMYYPWIMSEGQAAANLGTKTSVGNARDILYRDIDGVWKNMGTTGAADHEVKGILTAQDGSVYAYGGFNGMGGIANTKSLAKWNGTAWSSLSTLSSGYFWSGAAGPDGAIYIGGAFSLLNAVANTNSIAKWNGTAWSALGTGMDGAVSDRVVTAIVMDGNGNLYAGGNFASVSGVANTAKVAMWNGTAWVSVGGGLPQVGGVVYALAIGKDGCLYAAGGGLDANGNDVMKFDGTSWVGIGISNAVVYALTVGRSGALWAGGNFTVMGGKTANRIAYYSGSSWATPAGTGFDGEVDALATFPDGIYIGGQFTAVNGITLPDRAVIFNGAAWIPIDMDVQDEAAYVYAFAKDRAGRLYVGGEWSGTTVLASTVTVPNVTGARAYPTVTMTGPGTVWQLKNFSMSDPSMNAKVISFKGLTLQAGETATFVFKPGAVSFTSDWRGDLMEYVAEGSDLDFYLIAGSNNVCMFVTGDTAATTIFMTWEPLYNSMDKTER